MSYARSPPIPELPLSVIGLGKVGLRGDSAEHDAGEDRYREKDQCGEPPVQASALVNESVAAVASAAPISLGSSLA
ncbi:hypothetical protein [Actinocatenispora rupis]|uniref:Uncharacterized protein n=1 Tax=Actinocatenispora rupis TaxID=519421 RepID=A0A8J3NDH4_9ACTN|nr:hypothetical protein [Actinocatenispora rupis]GID15334.1 hypothetical protein Aru02nite_62230 [Actinocatenispora rupis]